MKNPFDGPGKDDGRDQRIPGKLKSPFDGGKPDERDQRIPGRVKLPADDKPRKDTRKDYPPRKQTRRERTNTIRPDKKTTPEEDLRNKN